jgi:hypothetical protein
MTDSPASREAKLASIKKEIIEKVKEALRLSGGGNDMSEIAKDDADTILEIKFVSASTFKPPHDVPVADDANWSPYCKNGICQAYKDPPGICIVFKDPTPKG